MVTEERHGKRQEDLFVIMALAIRRFPIQPAADTNVNETYLYIIEPAVKEGRSNAHPRRSDEPFDNNSMYENLLGTGLVRLRLCLGPFGGPACVFIRNNCFASVDKLGPLLCRECIYIAGIGHLGAKPLRSGAIGHHQKIASRSFGMRKDRARYGCQYGGERSKIKPDAKEFLSSNSDVFAVIMVAPSLAKLDPILS